MKEWVLKTLAVVITEPLSTNICIDPTMGGHSIRQQVTDRYSPGDRELSV